MQIIIPCRSTKKKSGAIVIARLPSSCKNFNKNIKGVNTKLKIVAHLDKMQLQDYGQNSEIYISGVMPLFNFTF